MNEIPRNDFAGSLAYAVWFWSNSQAVFSGDNLSGISGSIGIGNSRLELAAENNGGHDRPGRVWRSRRGWP